MYLQFNNKKGKNGKVYSTVLLCEKYRDRGVPKTRVILNLSKAGVPNEVITALKTAINKPKGKLIDSNDIKITRTLDYGYIYLILNLMEKLRISETLDKTYGIKSNLIKLMIVGKIITKGSKLEIFNWIKRNQYLAQKLSVDVDALKVDDLYYELGELSRLQTKLEKKWNVYHRKRHENIYLYDITSTYFEGTKNELAAFGYNRDGKKGKMQITIGLITDSTGFPLKIQVFEGNITDHKTVNEQIATLRDSFKAKEIILVGDRGMRIRLNLEELSDEQKQGVSYISALSNSEIRALIKDDVIQLELFSKELVEIKEGNTRYILSNNPVLEQEKNQTRESLKKCFDEEIIELKRKWDKRRNKNIENQEKLKNGHKNKKLVTRFSEKQIDSFKYRATSLLKRYKMTKFYKIKISNEIFEIHYDLQSYQNEKLLDGKYIIESTVNDEMTSQQVREKYKELQNVEHAFRDLKTDKLNIRPLYHRKEEQTRGHVFVSMFSYAIIKEIEKKVYPWLIEYNKKNNSKLSYKDIADELNNIKASELEFGYKLKKIMIPELNSIQTEIINLFNMKVEDIIKM